MRIVFSVTRSDVPIPAIFIDRDGVINVKRSNDYVFEWSQFVFTPGIRTALRELATFGMPLILISNQAAVGKGLLKLTALKEITARMQESLLEDGIRFAACYYCTHRADEDCDCRKPRPGMICQAAADFNIDISQSVLIGDSETDIQAARTAGCQPILFGEKLNHSVEPLDKIDQVPIARTARELVRVSATCLKSVSKRSRTSELLR